RRLLQWVTAADAEGRRASRRAGRLPAVAAALLALPGLLVPATAAAALALAALFWVAPGWVGDMEAERTDAQAPLTTAERRAFMGLARDTWRFFADNVPFPGGALPPDNVQLDPPAGAARRTSPTNIALYLLGCLSARRLGLIGLPEMRGRAEAALDALARMEKWHGQLYNWYDIDTLAPLRPRYVSSVDSGNLAAALLLCGAAPEFEGDLSRRMTALAEAMELDALYDGRRELFFIGMDAETGKLSDARYDLLASEARLLSYVAMMLGQAPARHWRRLGRPCVRLEGGVAPLSWSGTMFEYLMPELFLEEPRLSLLGEGVRAAVRAQMAHGRRRSRPWGVSESGYCAVDAALNYQYRAFGLPALALDGEAEAGVVAPYASMLAAMVVPKAAARNLDHMRALGWTGDWGLYEAADYLRPDRAGGPSLVLSHMAHHQGMALCALCNALTGNSLRRDFMGLPRARALSLLLEERVPTVAGAGRGDAARRRPPAQALPRLARLTAPDALAPQTHLLSGGGATALCTSDGAVHYWRDGVWATRFEGVLQGRRDRARTWLTDVETGAQTAVGDDGTRVSFEPGAARFTARLGGLEANMTVCVSCEDGTLLRDIELRNAGERPVRCAMTDIVPVALCSEADWRAHAAFQCLSVTSRALDGDALEFRRLPGSRGADGPRLMHLAVGAGEITREADYGKLAGRMGDADAAAAFDAPLGGHVGATLNPVSALRLELRLEPGRRARVGFMTRLLDPDAPLEAWLARWRRGDQPVRTARLASARARAALAFMEMDAERYHALQRMAALLIDGTLAAQARGPRRGEGSAPRERLWPLGLSGDRPILAMSVTRPEDCEAARALIRAHEFYRSMGLAVDLILVDDGEAGYARPVRDRLEALISASHLNGLRGVAGGVWLLEGGYIAPESRAALRRAASAWFTGSGEFQAQV
ncbi:MAG: hypothetical protein IKQ80_04810, partial [Clostridia bacterium]|nr:hypothetical protein [Clostridia bacterium]